MSAAAQTTEASERTSEAGAARRVNELARSGAAEFLTFTLGPEHYGVDILKVQEIRGYDAVTRIANTPPHLKGVINLRGIIVPIVDMRIKLNLGQADYNQFTVMIVVGLARRIVGIVVDSVSDVVRSPRSRSSRHRSSAPPAIRVMSGLGNARPRILILVDIEQIVTG